LGEPLLRLGHPAPRLLLRRQLLDPPPKAVAADLGASLVVATAQLVQVGEQRVALLSRLALLPAQLLLQARAALAVASQPLPLELLDEPQLG